MSSLFRQQAVDAQHKTLYGQVSLAQPISLYLFLPVILIVTILLISTLKVYFNKSTNEIVGKVVSSKELVDIKSEKNLKIQKVLVKEGQPIQKGTLVIKAQINHKEKYEVKEVDDILASSRSELHKKKLIEIKNKENLLNIGIKVNKDKIREIEQWEKYLEKEIYSLSLQKKESLELIELKEKLIKSRQQLLDFKLHEIKLKTNLESIKYTHFYEKFRFKKTENLDRVLLSNENEIQSDVNGIIANVKVRKNYFAMKNETLISILPSESKFLVEFSVSKDRFKSLKVGSELSFKLNDDEFKGKRFTGYIQSLRVYKIRDNKNKEKELLKVKVGIPGGLNERLKEKYYNEFKNEVVVYIESANGFYN